MKHSVCFIGHRKIEDTPELRENLKNILQELIKNGTVNFIFGDHSAFDDLCYELVTELKEKYPEIKRINFRKDYEDTDDYTMQFLIVGYEESICPKGGKCPDAVVNDSPVDCQSRGVTEPAGENGSAGRASYVERNQAMIRESDVCIFYYDENYQPSRRKISRRDLFDYQPKSGTAVAYAYAVQKKKQIYNLFEK